MAFTLTSPAFEPGEEIPVRYTCDGANVSPPLEWRGVPEGTRSFLLIVEDPDAPSGTFTHWILWDLPGTCTHLPAGDADHVPGQAGRNDFGGTGWGGPCPPRGHGAHRYHFLLAALDRSLRLPRQATRAQVDAAAAEAHLGAAMLEGHYGRR